MPIDAIVAAAGTPQPGEPLYPLTRGRPKSLLEIGGRPMIQWVLDALSGAPSVRRVIIVGLAAGDAALTCSKEIVYLAGGASLVDTVVNGAQFLREHYRAEHALMVSSDIPTLTAEMVEWEVRAALETDHQGYYALIPREVMERRFPGSRRTYFTLRDGRFCGGDMNLLKTEIVADYNPAWRKIADARKNILKQAALVGVDTLLWLALGRLSTAQVERRVRERLGVDGRFLICPYAEIGMDVDKPAQYEMLKRELEQGQRM
jgi:CTP:molybdopterin cytidylyltransferase MocA